MRSRSSNQNLLMQAPKYKYSFNQKLYDLSISSSLDNKLPFTYAGKNNQTSPYKIKSGSNFSLQKITTSQDSLINNTPKIKKGKDYFKLPTLKKKQINPQDIKIINTIQPYYQSKILKSIKDKDNTYLMNLARQHFIQSIQALRIGKSIKITAPQKQIKLNKKYPKYKTIYLDMDQTLIHCDQNSNSYTVKLNFPIQGGGIIAAGIRIRPYCQEFLKQLSSFAEIIIFTASSASYADIVLDHLDPNKKYISHRLYRQHCTLQKNFFVKDLRVINRRLEDSLLVDNSAFSFMLQPQNGVPILPYYHLAKDKQLLALLQFLKKAVQYADMRELIKQTFFWDKYLTSQQIDPRKIFLGHYGQQ